MNDAKRFVKDQVEAVTLARESVVDACGSEGHRFDAWHGVLRHMEVTNEQLSFEQTLTRAKGLAEWFRGA